MSWFTSNFYFTIISMILVMSSSLPVQQMMIPLQDSTLSLEASPTLHGKTQNMKHSPFIMQLYQTLVLGNTTDLSSLEYSTLQDSDTILSLNAKNCSQLTKHWELSFDMSSITRNIEIQLAELRIHSAPGRTRDVTLDISHSKEGKGKIFLGSVKIDFSIERGPTLKTINITRMIQSYFYQGEHFNIKNDQKEGMPKNGPESSCTEVSTDRVVLVVFTKDNPANLHGYPNLIQTVESSKHVMTPLSGIKKIRKSRSAEQAIIMANFPKKSTVDGKPVCRRVDMMLNFVNFGWGDQVIYPQKINAYRCEGACPIPLSEIFKPTNNAYIKSLVKLYNSDGVDDYPSCVPVKMKPLSMLMNEGGRVVMKNHEDMIVEDCGCH
ncbi:nodal homolog 2-A-like [Dendrobates tinctorius]|uniref:nodal homolog 2-A-like n=1 Tax=Dendrobates tinctorius TaxID=92724 RepID=UPI003CC98885